MECVNWTAGILGFILFWVPSILVLFWLHKMNEKADRDYEEKMKEIRQFYG